MNLELKMRNIHCRFIIQRNKDKCIEEERLEKFWNETQCVTSK